jgi:hypothetical protein
MATESESSSTPEQATLRRNAIGLPGVLFQSITTMAPASAVSFSLGAAIPFAGGAVYSGAIVSAEPGRSHLRRLVCAWPDCRCLTEHARTGESGA